MDFRHLIVTCLFSMLRLSFETQKIKENYAIFSFEQELFQKQQDVLMFFHSYCITWQNTLFFFQKFQSLRKRPVHRLFG